MPNSDSSSSQANAGEDPKRAEGEATPPPATGDTALWTLKGGSALLAIFSLPLAWAACSHPPVDAVFKTSPPRGATVIELAEATLVAPLYAELGSFDFHQIPPRRSTATNGMGKELLIRLRVAGDSCGELEEQIGGSCQRPKPPLHAPESLTIQAEKGALEALLTATSAETLRLEQTTEPRRPGEPEQWSLTESASRTTLRLRCVVPTPLGVSLLPGQANPECAPDEAIYKLLIVNRRPYLPTLSFNRTLVFTADTEARWGAITVDRGRLTQEGSVQAPPVTEPTEVALAAAEGDRVRMRLGSPDQAGITATGLSASRAEAALLDWRDETVSRLDRHPMLRSWGLGILGGLLVLVLINLIVVVAGRRERK